MRAGPIAPRRSRQFRNAAFMSGHAASDGPRAHQGERFASPSVVSVPGSRRGSSRVIRGLGRRPVHSCLLFTARRRPCRRSRDETFFSTQHRPRRCSARPAPVSLTPNPRGRRAPRLAHGPQPTKENPVTGHPRRNAQYFVSRRGRKARQSARTHAVPMNSPSGRL
jgi:hypothetical protein